VTVTVWQYPDRPWARYETRLFNFATLWHVEQYYVLATAQDYYWYSDNSVLNVSGDPHATRAALDAYLAKHPSSIEPSFPLFAPEANR
jgi:hypothetical protein